MKPVRIIMTLAATATIFASCAKTENNTEPADGRVRFTSGIDAATRVGGENGDRWDAGDAIGVYMFKHSTFDVAEGAENIKYTTTSTTVTANFTSLTPVYYPVNGDKVDFVAYYPYTPSMNGYIYPVNVAVQDSQTAIDLMSTPLLINSGAGYDKTNPSAINLDFSHELVKVVMNVTAGAGIDDLDDLVVTIKGMYTRAEFNPLASGIKIANQQNVADIVPYHAGGNVYEAILLPVNLSGSHIVEFTVGGETYKWTMRDNNSNIIYLREGRKYVFDIKVQKTGVTVIGTIFGWTNAPAGSGTAN